MSRPMKVVDFDFDSGLLERFLDFPRQHYASDSNWIPDPAEPRLLAKSGFSPTTWRNFLVINKDEILGRVTALINPHLCHAGNRPYAQLGFFECVDDLRVAQLLVEKAAVWLRSNLPNGASILAPMNFDTWHSYRLRTKGFSEPTIFMEPYNPSYYPTLMTALGFNPTSRYVTKTVNDLQSLMEAWEANHDQVFSQGYRVRSFNLSDPVTEMSLIYRLALDAFRDNLFYTDIPEDEFRALYASAAGRLDPDLFLFILDPQGEPVGLCFSIADHRRPNMVNVKTFGILPHVRSEGVGAALAYVVYQRFQAKGFLRVNHCLVRAGNRADKFDGGLGEITREYTLYARSL